MGEIGEKLAKMFLMKHGYTVMETNYTQKLGEIDIVAKKADIWHFIEVKSVSREMIAISEGKDVTHESTGIRPEENMHDKKIQRFVRTVEHYLMANNLDVEHQIDLALVYIDPVRKIGKVKLMENIV